MKINHQRTLDNSSFSRVKTNEIVMDTPGNATSAFCGSNVTRPGYCPEFYDTLMCWPESKAGTMVKQLCPRFSWNSSAFVYRQCLSNGAWYVSPESGMRWANYSNCFDEEHLNFYIYINYLFVVGYSISLAALLISLVIFFSFRSLKCTRIKIHIQLFISFALNNVFWIIWYKEVVPYVNISQENPIWCQLLHILVQYFMVANYMWMFCEGLHLHLALVVVFVREEVIMKWFYAIGWGLPVLVVHTYALTRYFTEDTSRCWMEEAYYTQYILTVPVILSLLASLVFLIKAVVVILTIMHPNSRNPAPMSLRRAARAALILIPLFGLQHILIPFKPAKESPYERLYEYITVAIVSPQGLCVSCLFCFANHEVHQAIKGFFHRLLHRPSRFSNYFYTGAGESGGVYVLNGTNQTSLPMLSVKRKSTTTTLNL